jgi:His/Glu/Gln/Arg/opine family amino acid ABC transporter permease subunit
MPETAAALGAVAALASAAASFLSGFLPAFFSGLAVNVGIAAAAVAGGLLAGLPLALARQGPGRGGQVAAALVAPLRAAPTFVVMFFLLNVLPRELALGPWTLAVSPWTAVALALAVYATAYVSDTATVALQQWHEGARGAALLWLMGLLRSFFVMVLSSGFGAAIGVVEATTVTLRALETLPTLGGKLALMGLVVTLFVALFQTLYALTDRVRGALAARLARVA